MYYHVVLPLHPVSIVVRVCLSPLRHRWVFLSKDYTCKRKFPHSSQWGTDYRRTRRSREWGNERVARWCPQETLRSAACDSSSFSPGTARSPVMVRAGPEPHPMGETCRGRAGTTHVSRTQARSFLTQSWLVRGAGQRRSCVLGWYRPSDGVPRDVGRAYRASG
jgi:hypothetical protein